MFFTNFIGCFILRFNNALNLRLPFKMFIKRFNNIFVIILIFFIFKFRLFIFISFVIIVTSLFNILISFIYIISKGRSKRIFFNFYKLRRFDYNLSYNLIKIFCNILERIWFILFNILYIYYFIKVCLRKIYSFNHIKEIIKLFRKIQYNS